MSHRTKTTERRRRPKYPTLTPGQAVLVERPECGRNVELASVAREAKRARRVLRGCFIFQREMPRPPSSKYEPHVGRKQRERATT